ncbi:outer membrane protein assembly factor BamB family protein [Allorhodopirellula solitaria]|uniref:Outer membrane protein assembly factor BamB n=1 Tax=Allorhodopirellula solitaria TaxID=2527987 RepID=A0A5C5XTX1_9BACT|nr:PQQ-binding-like beta-propeller repeat protein [Allorhodopirellula solitaria]TWT65991.1 Outer membrane protein assembly factor BamB precursor [Allorhodopirellula solitaria]
MIEKAKMWKSCSVLTLVACSSVAATADDWPQWQGPNRDAISLETGLMQQWPADGPPLAWRADGLGGGDSAPAIADGRIFGMSSRDGKEIVWALSQQDGSEEWASAIGDEIEQGVPQSKEGPGCTPTVDGERLYVIGMGGAVACLNVSDGTIVWQRSFADDFGGQVPAWSYRESPLVDGEKIICTPGGKDATMVALDKSTGEVIWKSKLPDPSPTETADQASSEQASGGRGGGRRGNSGRRRRGPSGTAGYASAIAIDFEGQRQYVQFTAKALIGVDAADGEVLWQYKSPANPIGISCTTPISQDGLIFATSAYGAGGGAVRLVKSADGEIEAQEVYFTPSMQNHHGGTIVTGGALYGANGGNGGGFLSCLDFKTGELLWRDRDAPKGSLAMADGRIYLRSEDGTMILIEPSREELVERGRFEQPDRSSAPAWAHPVVANGKLYIRDQGVLFCYDVAAE